MMAFLVWALSGRSLRVYLPEQGLAILSLMAVLMWAFPQAAAAQSVQPIATPKLAFEINEKINSFLSPADELASPRDIHGNKLNILKNYLIEKNSPLADHVEVLLLQSNWKTILAISHAESNMCRFQLGNNCWGIGGAKYHRYYPSFAEGIVDANDLIQKYRDRGLTTPKTMMHRWVGWNNQSWVRANNQVLAQLDELGL